MVVLGLLLMLACAALAVDAVVQNTGIMHAIAFNQLLTHLSLGAIFIAGAVVGLLFALGMAMFAGGVGRASRARRDRRTRLRESAAETESLRAENDRLERELRARKGTAQAYPTEPATTAVSAGETAGGRHRTG